MCKEMNHYFKLASDATIKGMERGEGGPFGATIVKDGEIIVSVGNTAMRDTDPSAHAEMVAVREACKKLDTMDLTGCEVYATCEPCPMCVSVMMWANIEKVYFSGTRDDAAEHGFSDMHLRNYLDGSQPELFDMEHIGSRDDCEILWTKFHEIYPEGF